MLTPIEIGKRMHDRRLELGLTLQDVADRVSVQNSTIYRYEKGLIKRVKLPVIEAIASALQISPGYLVGKTDDKNAFDPGGKFNKMILPEKCSDKAIKIVCQIDSELYDKVCTLADEDNRSFENEMEYLLYWAVENEIDSRYNHTECHPMYVIQKAGRDGSFIETAMTSEEEAQQAAEYHNRRDASDDI